MKRFRLSTLLLLVVIAALTTALVVERERHARQLAELKALQTAVEVNSDRPFAFIPNGR